MIYSALFKALFRLTHAGVPGARWVFCRVIETRFYMKTGIRGTVTITPIHPPLTKEEPS